MTAIYLDYAATTPVDLRVANIMQKYLMQDGVFGNAASRHVFGRAAHDAIEVARSQLAQLIHADPSEIIWTSGATESNNLAIKGGVQLYQRKGKHIITVKTEHKSVLDPCQYLEKQGFTATYLTPDRDGRIDLQQLAAAIRADTVLISVMHVNNETGVIQEIAKIAELATKHDILFHVDAAQSAAKIAIDVQTIPIDFMSFSAHKMYGPKGIGALYLRKKPRRRVEPLLHGGGHEQGMRSGTLPTQQIVGMGEACRIVSEEREKDDQHIFQLREQLIQGLKNIANFQLNVDLNYTVPHILSVRFAGMQADALLDQLPELALSTASACQGKGTEGSYVLRAMGFDEEVVKSSIRFSFGKMTTIEEINKVIHYIKNIF